MTTRFLYFASELLQDSYPTQIWVTFTAARLWPLPWLSIEYPLYSAFPHSNFAFSLPCQCCWHFIRVIFWDKIEPHMSMNSYGNCTREKIRVGLRCTVTLVGQGNDYDGVQPSVFTCSLSRWDLCIFKIRLLNIKRFEVCSKSSTKITLLKGLSVTNRIKCCINISLVNEVSGAFVMKHFKLLSISVEIKLE